MHGIRRTLFHLPEISHESAEHLMEYCLMHFLNKEEDDISTTKKIVHTFSEFQTLSQDKGN